MDLDRMDAYAETPTPKPPRRNGRWIGGAIALLLAVGAGYFALSGHDPFGWRMPEDTREASAQPPQPSPPPAEPAAPDLPPETDPDVRGLLAGLSAEPGFGQWIASGELIRRFTGAVARIADGESPRSFLGFMAPAGGFQVEVDDGAIRAAPEGHARYDGVARVIGSLDAQAAGRAYRRLRPLFDAAFKEIAPPSARFEQTLAKAIGRLVAVPVPAGRVELLEQEGVGYVYASAELEAQSAAAKHLLRMGPRNMRLVQAKLRELAAAAELSLPLPTTAER